MKRRILVLGAKGRLGAAIARRYAGDYEVAAWGRAEVDLGQLDSLASKVQDAKPDTIINCAAITSLEQCEARRDEAESVNARAPEILGRVARDCGARLLQISTDYVFSGNATALYAENDAPDPLSWYGQTKLAGEKGAMAGSPDSAVVRVSWVFGPDRDAFIDTALGAAVRGEGVRAVADKFSSPSYTHDISDALRPLVEGFGNGGIYHVCNRGVCSWRDWAQETIDAAVRLGAKIETKTVQPLRLSAVEAMKVPRPIYSAMSCERIEALLGRPMRPWQEAVADYVRLLMDCGRLSR